MKKSKIYDKLIEIKHKFIESIKHGGMGNYDGKSFSRNRLLMFGRLLTTTLRCSPCGLQIHLDDYYKEIDYKENVVSKQAFSKARTKLDPDIVKASFELTTKTILESGDTELFKGKFRLCAVDAMTRLTISIKGTACRDD